MPRDGNRAVDYPLADKDSFGTAFHSDAPESRGDVEADPRALDQSRTFVKITMPKLGPTATTSTANQLASINDPGPAAVDEIDEPPEYIHTTVALLVKKDPSFKLGVKDFLRDTFRREPMEQEIEQVTRLRDNIQNPTPGLAPTLPPPSISQPEEPSPPSTSNLPPSRTQGRPYEKVVQVGEGTYGKVYKARNALGLGLVALKRIRMEGEKDGFPVTAMREVKLLQGLCHENVIRLHEMMVAHGQSLIAVAFLLDP